MGRARSKPEPKRRRKPSGQIELRDPGALRALAHPARLIIVDELYQGNERTASELAALTDLSPSAMSYHLRALERWGVIERADGRTDERERPWRARARSLRLDSDLSEAGAAAQDVISGGYFELLREAYRKWSLVEAGESRVWRDVAGFGRSFLWLTEQEAEAFSEELGATVRKYIGDRDAVDHPEGTRRVLLVIGVVPTVPAADG